MNSSVVLISNPAARGASGKKLRETVSLLEAGGHTVRILETAGPGNATALAAAAAADKPSFVVAAGGDGTINEVINGLAGTDVPLALLPLGTTNVLARELGLPRDVGGIVKRMLERAPRQVSLGVIELTEQALRRHFCLMAGIGFDALSVYGMHPGIKRLSGEAAYLLSGIRSLAFHAPGDLTVALDGTEHRCTSLIVGKASRYGGDFSVTPGASLLSPTLHACLFAGRGRADLLRYAWGIVRGTHLAYKDVRVIEARVVSVRGSAHIQIDGDYLGRLPARLSVDENALRVIW